MDPTKLPSKEAKSLSFLAYSLICLLSSSVVSDSSTKIILWIFAAFSFLLAAVKFLKDNLKFPLWPCKNRCNENAGFVCIRDKGFYCGCFVSLVMVFLIKLFQIHLPINKVYFLFIAIICTASTIVHGTLRRYFDFLNSEDRLDKSLTFLTGFITGLGIFFVAIYFI